MTDPLLHTEIKCHALILPFHASYGQQTVRVTTERCMPNYRHTSLAQMHLTSSWVQVDLCEGAVARPELLLRLAHPVQDDTQGRQHAHEQRQCATCGCQDCASLY